MGIETSTSNEGSNNKENRLNRYTEAKQKNVSWDELNKIIDNKGFANFDINSMAVSFNDNVKIIGGEENDVTEATSHATYEFDMNNMTTVLANVREINDKNIAKITARREKEKAKRKAKRKAEAEAAKSNVVTPGLEGKLEETDNEK